MSKKKRKTIAYRSAGGVVMADDGRVLQIERRVKRHGKMIHEIRLPKGHIDPGETPEQAAMREVCEESGFCHLQIIADLGGFHTSYDFRKKHYERDERYFLMRLTQPDRQPPQPKNEHSEEALFTPLWASSLAEAEALQTYEAEKNAIRRARAWLAQQKQSD